MLRYRVMALTMILVTILWCQSAVAQGYTASVKGVVTKDNQPAPNLEVVLTNPNTGKQYKTKTDKNGEYFLAGIQIDTYRVEVIASHHEVLYTREAFPFGSNDLVELKIDLAKPELSGGVAGGTSQGSAGGAKQPKMTKEQIKAEQEKVAAMNTLLQQAQGALQSQKWPEAETALKQVIAAYPETTKWELYRALAEAQKNQDKLDDAAQTFEKGIQVADAVASGKAPQDPRNPNPDPARAKAGEGQMLGSLGSIYVKQGKMDQAITTYQKAAATDPNPAVAYFNLCALAFNARKYDDAAAACDKSAAADPNKADAWFFKGAALAKANKPGAADAMNKYLQLDANGTHAAEAKAILQSAK